MKRYVHILSISALIHVTLVNSFNIKQVKEETLYKKSHQARVIAYVLFNDKEAAGRYVKHAEFYTKKVDRFVFNDGIIDHIVYPVVDTVVGRGMSKLNEIESVHAATENISKSNRRFLANNMQLITSAGAVQLIRIELGKGIKNIGRQDIKSFGRSCAAQVGCDVVDEFLVKPAVEAYIGDTNSSWTAWGLRGLGNYVFAQIVIDRVSKL